MSKVLIGGAQFHERRHNSHHQYITSGGSAGRQKFTTRHLAALDFLLNVPMAKEAKIREAGLNNASRRRIEGNDDDNGEDEDSVDGDDFAGSLQLNSQQDDSLFFDGQIGIDSAGIKLKGPSAAIVRYPPFFRYYFYRLSQNSAVVRKWEEETLIISHADSPTKVPKSPETTSKSAMRSRMFLSRARNYPFMVSSVIKYDAGEEKARQEKIRADDRKGLEVFELPRRDWRGFSYKKLFKPEHQYQHQQYLYDHGAGYVYDPDSLDDPGLIHGSHRVAMQRAAATGPVMSSVILYVKKQELKQSLNEQFRERHPHLPPSLTLSKIRNIKKQVLLLALSVGIEISTVAIAIISFERLCLQGLITKFNRRLAIAVSLILAVKFNETTIDADYHFHLQALLSFFDREWNIPKKQIFEAEFGTYVHLGFFMHLPYKHIYLSFSRLLKLVNYSSKQYLGEAMNEVYMQEVVDLERSRESANFHSAGNNGSYQATGVSNQNVAYDGSRVAGNGVAKTDEFDRSQLCCNSLNTVLQ